MPPPVPRPGAAPESAAEPVVGRAAVALLAYLTLLNVLNFVDRTLIGSLGPLLIADLGLSRTELGLLAGFGFVVFYTLVGILLGLAADRWSRLRLLAGGLALWSAMTAISGLAKSFLHLLIPRIFVGVGEATLTPAALSMLGDAFPRHRLGLATGIYYTGVPLGTRAIQLPDTQYRSYLMDTFGRPARQVVCECERTATPNIAQALHLLNGDFLNRKIADKAGRVEKLATAKAAVPAAVTELYLATVSRPPTPAEAEKAAAWVKSAKTERDGLQDLLWALVNSKEFLFNH
jgi:hypothetical protein